jgi:hypothetical protein
MSFYHRYELVKLVYNGDPKSFEAREIQGGQPALLHLWSMGGDSPSAALLARMRGIVASYPAQAAGRIIDVQESAQPPYAVTAVEPGFSTLESWLDSLTASLRPEQSPAAAPAIEPTLQFETPPAPPVAVQPPSFTPPPPPPQPATPPVQPQYQPPAVQAVPQPPAFAAPQPPPPAAVPPVQQQYAAAPPPPPPAAVLSQTPEPPQGEFTRLFQGSIAQPASPAPPPPQAAPFTPPAAAAPPAQPAQQMGEFTRLFASPSAQPAAPPPPSAAPAQSQGAGMGEFTRMFASPTAQPAPPPVQPPPQAFTPQPAFPPDAPPPTPVAPAPSSAPTSLDSLFAPPPAQPSAPPDLFCPCFALLHPGPSRRHQFRRSLRRSRSGRAASPSAAIGHKRLRQVFRQPPRRKFHAHRGHRTGQNGPAPAAIGQTLPRTRRLHPPVRSRLRPSPARAHARHRLHASPRRLRPRPACRPAPPACSPPLNPITGNSTPAPPLPQVPVSSPA